MVVHAYTCYLHTQRSKKGSTTNDNSFHSTIHGNSNLKVSSPVVVLWLLYDIMVVCAYTCYLHTQRSKKRSTTNDNSFHSTKLGKSKLLLQ